VQVLEIQMKRFKHQTFIHTLQNNQTKLVLQGSQEARNTTDETYFYRALLYSIKRAEKTTNTCVHMLQNTNIETYIHQCHKIGATM